MRKLLLLIALGFIHLQSCVPVKQRITSSGIFLYSIGDPFNTSLVNTTSENDRDTVFAENEYTWRGLILQYPDGIVLLEEDFNQEEIINRIRIETPSYQLKNGIKQGDPVDRLKRTHANWNISAYPNYGLFEFYSTKFPGIHFLVKAPGIALDADKLYSPGDFVNGGAIEAIVVF